MGSGTRVLLWEHVNLLVICASLRHNLHEISASRRGVVQAFVLMGCAAYVGIPGQLRVLAAEHSRRASA